MPPPYKMRVIYRPGRHQTGSQEAHTSLIENLLHSTPRKQATTTSGNDEAEAGELYYTCHPTSQPAKPSYHGEDGGEQQQRRRRRRQEEDVQGRADAELGLVGVGGASARPEDADMARLPRHRRGRGARARRRAALPPGLGGRPQLPAPPPVRPAPRGHHVAQSHPARGRRRRQRLLLLLRRWRRLAPPFAPRAENNGTSACSDGDGDATPASSTTSSPTSHADDVSSPDSTVSSAGDVDYYTSLADIDAFFQSPKCVVDYALMDPCSAFFAPDSTAADDDGGCCWAWEEDGGGIALWSFSATLDC
jgi:hypothetical protein